MSPTSRALTVLAAVGALTLVGCSSRLNLPAESPMTPPPSASPTPTPSPTTSESSSGPRMAVGSCYEITGRKAKAAFTKVDCADTSQVAFLIVDEGPGAPTCRDSEYGFTYNKLSATNAAYSCMVPMLAESACYGNTNGILTLQSCSAPDAESRVARRIDSYDPQACAGTAWTTTAFVRPGITYCFAKLR